MTFADLIRKERKIEASDDEYYWDVANETKMERYLNKTEYKFINQCLRKNPFIHDILDVGGGDGTFAVPLYEKGFNVIVLEKNLLLLRKCEKRKKEIGTILADGNQLPIADSTFDCILCIEVLGHLSVSFFDEYYRILKKNGILIFTLGNPLIQRYLEKHFHRSYSYKEYAPTLRDVKTQLLEKGFKIESARSFRWIPAGRGSNNKFILLFQLLEKIFCLRFLRCISPWLLIMARKVK